MNARVSIQATIVENRDWAAMTLRRYFLAEAVAHGLARDLDLTFDGGHVRPGAGTQMHVAEFHANGMMVRKALPDRAISEIWLGMDSGLAALREAVAELCAIGADRAQAQQYEPQQKIPDQPAGQGWQVA